MRVLLVVHDFPPALNSAARLMGELADDLRGAGHAVTVLTRRRKGAPKRPGVRTARGLPLPRAVPGLRALDQLWLSLAMVWAGLRLPKQDAVIVYSPPLPFTTAALLLCRLWRCPMVANVQDLYPRTAVELGLMRRGPMLWLAERMESLAYRKAAATAVHSPGARAYLIAKGAPPERVHLVYNWIDLEAGADADADAWRARHGLSGSFLVTFAGTMGFAQGLETVTEAAALTLDSPSIVWALAGGGVMRGEVERAVRERNLTNVRLLPPQPPDDYYALLRASDAGLVTLSASLTVPVTPGKAQALMAAGAPIVCAAHPATDLKRLVEESGAGVFVEAGDAQGLADAVLALRADPERARRMSEAGRAFAAERFDRRRAAAAYTSLLRKLTEK